MSPSAAIVAGVTVSLVVFIALVLILFWVVRRRRARYAHVSSPSRQNLSLRNAFLEPSHPACHVTPYGAPGGDTPRFVHEPGVNMRIAHRRLDGGWEFSELTPDNLSTLDSDLAPRLSLSGRSTLSYASHVKDKKSKLQPGELTTRGFVDHSDAYTETDVNPPPAYQSPTEEAATSEA